MAEASRRVVRLGLALAVGAAAVLAVLGAVPAVHALPPAVALAEVLMADYIAAHALDVVVSRYCISSCANYLFVAGRRKIVLPDSFLGFHGGPGADGPIVNDTSMPLTKAVALLKVIVARVISRQDAFYRRIGVDGSIIYKAPYPVVLDHLEWSHMFWEAGPTLLRDRYGVRGIDYFATPSRASPLQALRAAILGGVSCKQIGADAWLCRS